jgi:hypothetical protein
MLALLGIYEPKETIDILLSLLGQWDLTNPKSGAYRTRSAQFQYRPLPIASCFYAIEKAIGRFDSSDVDVEWLSTRVFPILHRVSPINSGTE